MKVAIVVLWQQIFLHFGADDFPFKVPFGFKIVVYAVLELQFV